MYSNEWLRPTLTVFHVGAFFTASSSMDFVDVEGGMVTFTRYLIPTTPTEKRVVVGIVFFHFVLGRQRLCQHPGMPCAPTPITLNFSPNKPGTKRQTPRIHLNDHLLSSVYVTIHKQSTIILVLFFWENETVAQCSLSIGGDWIFHGMVIPQPKSTLD